VTRTLPSPDINTSPEFTNAPANIPVYEGVAIGTTVYTVSHNDNDAMQTKTFTFEANAYFEMSDTSSGF